MPASFEIIPAYVISLAEQARVANEGFAGYVAGWTDLNAETLARFLTLQGADLLYSRFVGAEGKLAGFGYITMTGKFPRLSGMAIVPEFRGGGAAQHLMQSLLDEARDRDDEAMMLEVIQQNPRAHSFYRRNGFHALGQLLGWRRRDQPELSGGETVAISELPILSALQMPAAAEYPAIPWQISRHAIAKASTACAFAAEDCCVVISDPTAPIIRVHGFFGASADHETLRRTLASVIAHYPDREFLASAIFPEPLGAGVFQPLGFSPEPISQFLMRRDL